MTKIGLNVITIGKQKTCIFAFGRLNPPHQGHEELIERVAFLSSQLQAEPRIYLSTSGASSKDPLTLERKLYWSRLSFPHGHFFKAEGSGDNPVDSIIELHKEGFDSLVVVCGTERAQSFCQYLKKFNGTDVVNFKVASISVINRDVDSLGKIKKSGSLIRQLAEEIRFPEFSDRASRALANQQKKGLFEETRAALQKFSGVKAARSPQNPASRMLPIPAERVQE